MPIKQLTLKDCAEAAYLHQAAFYKGWKEQDFQEFLQNPLIQGLKIEENHQIIGYILWQHVGEEAEILTLIIDPLHQRKGKGNKLLSALFKRLKDQGIMHLFLEVAEDNKPAQLFYINHGFILISKRPKYYSRKQNTFISALNLYKKLV